MILVSKTIWAIVFLCMAITLPVAAQSIKKNTYYEKDIVKESFTVLDSDTNLKHGDYKMYFPSGKLATECTYENGQKNGAFKVYYESETPRLSGAYSKGFKIGEMIYYTPENSIEKIEVYEYGTPPNFNFGTFTQLNAQRKIIAKGYL